MSNVGTYLRHVPLKGLNYSGRIPPALRLGGYQPVPAMIEPLRCVPTIEPSLGASP